jgi:hypothetical protein
MICESFARRLLCWLFGHEKKYVGVEDRLEKKDAYPKDCPHGWSFIKYCNFCLNVMQIARWFCQRCPKGGETYIWRGEGLFTVQFGKLVPDEKKWANFKIENAG